MVQAVAKAVRISPKKAREVASLVSGRSVEDALVILEHTPRRAAKPITKLINSAKANATNNHNLSENDLRIISLQVTDGGSMKRWRPAARGRALPYRHRMSHIAVVVDGKKAVQKTAKNDDKKKSAKKTETKGEEK